MDCDDVILLLVRDGRTLTPVEEVQLDDHLSDCDACSDLVSHHELLAAAPRMLELPIVEPDRFEDETVIAAGGMGKITRAFDRRLGREVAIKEMLGPELRGRFEREAAITARLQHPAIVPVYEAGEWPNGSAFYTMRLVPGGTLADAIERATTLADRLALVPHVVAVTDALAYAHARGIIHRDLKPQNILVGEFGETVVIDWGLAKEVDEVEPRRDAAEAAPQLTSAGTVIGTPCFMPPEQARGLELDQRADVFSLGALLYNVLTGVPPYWDQSRDTKELIAAVLARPPTPLAELAPATPVDLRAIVERAMAREPVARYRDAGELAAELRRFQAGQLLLSRDYRVRDLLVRWIRRHRTVVTIAGGATLVLAIVAVIAAVKVTRAHELADTAFERGQRKLCASEAPALQSPWTAEARDLVHRQFATTKLPYVPQTLARIDARFEQWSAELATARELACAGTRPDLDRVLECLADATRDARALVSQFHDADQATVVNAVSATERLAPATACTARAFAPNPTVVDPERATAVRDTFARSHALYNLAKYRDGKAVALQSVTLATTLGDPGLLASALVARGQGELDLSEFTAAQATLEQALRLAETAQNDRARAQAWTNLVRIAYLRGHYDQVLELKDVALGATERIGDRWLESEIMLNVGGALTQQNKLAEAEALFAQAVAIRRALYGDRDRRLAFALSALGNAYAMEGKLDAGITAHHDALVTAEADLGADHPDVAVLHGNLADDYIYGLRAADAVAELERDVEISSTANGARDLAMALTDLGTARLEAGQHAAAIEAFDRADEGWRAVNANHPARADVLLGRYLARRALGQPAELADLEAANKLAAGLPPFMHARVQFALGMATHDPKLVAAAAAGYATSTLPLCQRDLVAANAWLAANH